MRVITFLSIVYFIQFARASEIKTQISEQEISYNQYAMESSVSFSTINESSRFMSVAIVADFLPWFSIGVEGDLPTDFEKQEQFYMARLLSRVYLLKNNNEVYIQPSVSQGFFNSVGDSGRFESLGLLFGYMRTLTNDWEFGGKLGTQLVNTKFENGNISARENVFNSRFSVVGAYRF